MTAQKHTPFLVHQILYYKYSKQGVIVEFPGPPFVKHIGLVKYLESADDQLCAN